MRKEIQFIIAALILGAVIVAGVLFLDQFIERRIQGYYFENEKVALQIFAEKAAALPSQDLKEFALTNYGDFLESYGELAFDEHRDLHYELFLTHGRLYKFQSALSNQTAAEQHFRYASNYYWLVRSNPLTVSMLTTNRVFDVEMK